MTLARVFVHRKGATIEHIGTNDYRPTNDLLNRLHDARIGGVPFLEAIAYRGVSMWQFLPSYIWPEVFRAVELAEIVAQVLDECEGQELEAVPLWNRAGAIWTGVVRGAGIPLVDAVSPPLRRRTPRSVAGVVKRRILRPRAVRWPQAARGGVLCVTQGARHWVSRPGRGDDYDEQFSPLIPALRAEGWRKIRLVDSHEQPPELFASRRLEGDAEWYVPGIFQGKIPRAARAHFADMWEALRADPAFGAALSHRGISLLPALEPTFRRAFHEILPACVGYLAGAAAILDATRPEVVIATYETGPHQRAMLIEASRRSIPTVGLMHGTIFDNHYDYMHANVTTDPIRVPNGIAIPRVTCVWGSIWRDVLVDKGHYPADALAITGNARIEEALAVEPREPADGKARLGLVGDRKLVLILTANQTAHEFLDVALTAVESHMDCVPLVKPHAADDVAQIMAVMEAHGFGESQLYRGNLADAIIAADLVVSQISTAALESMLLRRPLVLANLDRSTGFHEPMLEPGLAAYAETPAALTAAIASGLADDEFAARTTDLRRRFADRWFAGADGRAAERIAVVVTDLAATPRVPGGTVGHRIRS